MQLKLINTRWGKSVHTVIDTAEQLISSIFVY